MDQRRKTAAFGHHKRHMRHDRPRIAIQAQRAKATGLGKGKAVLSGNLSKGGVGVHGKPLK